MADPIASGELAADKHRFPQIIKKTNLCLSVSICGLSILHKREVELFLVDHRITGDIQTAEILLDFVEDITL